MTKFGKIDEAFQTLPPIFASSFDRARQITEIKLDQLSKKLEGKSENPRKWELSFDKIKSLWGTVFKPNNPISGSKIKSLWGKRKREFKVVPNSRSNQSTMLRRDAHGTVNSCIPLAVSDIRSESNYRDADMKGSVIGEFPDTALLDSIRSSFFTNFEHSYAPQEYECAIVPESGAICSIPSNVPDEASNNALVKDMPVNGD
ncbi:hypothetical protein QAD02_002359 [Eretmocerus hayati]|uniref:Uncharacterized protein n=1 Tax=Eretmocerus hayati TaxID=131215 RepID=A0ACC2NNI3_9HYME|nr:hypothetical protein QAD02_002359 [Eretmocerus hayati]